ncbi:hypothetical protein [Mycolicibacterium sp. XJ1819]
MLLSELLGLPVRDSDRQPVGTVTDVRLNLAEDRDTTCPTPQVFGLVVSPRTRSSYLGYERSGVNEPRVLAALLRWRHRGTRLVLWNDVARVDTDAVTLRPGFKSYSPALPTD